MYLKSYVFVKGTCFQKGYIKIVHRTIKSMAVAELLKNMSRDTLTPIIKNDGTDSFLLNSYVCGYYAY